MVSVPSYCYENSSYGKNEPESEYQYICHVPLEAIVANPKAYDGYHVYSEGFLKFDYHGDFLYLSCASAQAGRQDGQIGIRDEQYEPSDLEPMEGYVYHIVGKFSYSDMAIREARLHYLPSVGRNLNERPVLERADVNGGTIHGVIYPAIARHK